MIIILNKNFIKLSMNELQVLKLDFNNNKDCMKNFSKIIDNKEIDSINLFFQEIINNQFIFHDKQESWGNNISIDNYRSPLIKISLYFYPFSISIFCDKKILDQYFNIISSIET